MATAPPPVSSTADDMRQLWAGIGAGLIAGVAMAAFLTIDAEVTGAGAWLPERLIAGSVQGVRALVSGPGAIVEGILLHLLTSAMFGAIFAVLLGQRNPGAITILYGWAFALAILLAMTFVALPSIDPTMAARVRVVPVVWLIAHLIFGTGIALTPLLYGPRARVGARLPA